jgi:hypothetical protein
MVSRSGAVDHKVFPLGAAPLRTLVFLGLSGVSATASCTYHILVFCLPVLADMANREDGFSDHREDEVADLLKGLILTAEEEEVADFSDEEDEGVPDASWALVGKVLSPTIVHATSIQGAMKPAWGNPAGLNIRMVGAKEENLFVAEFCFKQDMERALGGSPWVVAKHAVILREYDERLKPSEISFDTLDIWVRILDLPLGWMNKLKGERAMGLIGEVKKMDVDGGGKASGPFLRARVAIEVSKPVHRGVKLKTKKDGSPEWFEVQYEKLPFYCLVCGIIGHSQLNCDKPLVRNAEGKLPYDGNLRVFEPRRRKMQSFSEAAAESFGRESSSHSKREQARGDSGGSGSSDAHNDKVTQEENREVPGPQFDDSRVGKGQASNPLNARHVMFKKSSEGTRGLPRKRKSKMSEPGSDNSPGHSQLPMNNMAIVPAGSVSIRVNQLFDDEGDGDPPAVPDELSKKQKKEYSQPKARSVAAAMGSPRRAQ